MTAIIFGYEDFACYIPLKRANAMPLIIVEYHSVSFSTIGPFNDQDSVVLSTVI